jgi:peptide chain release factor subunit 3
MLFLLTERALLENMEENIEAMIQKAQTLQITPRPPISIVFIGHVDAGKSTIGGQILCQLDMVDKRTMEKYMRESAEKNRGSWYLSWALDTNPEEREKGKTTEVGRACFELSSRKVFILDAPGHKMYVSDMISGANQGDVAVLVVSARINEFETGFDKGGQTREHVLLAKAGGIKKMIVLVNKMDDESVKWCEERYKEIETRLGNLLRRVYLKDDILFIPVSGFMGHNIKDRVDPTICSWYKGPSFLEILDNLILEKRDRLPFLASVNEKLKITGLDLYGIKVESGLIKRGDAVRILPKNIDTTVVGLYNDEDIEIDQGVAGDMIKIKFKDSQDEVGEGDMLCDPGNADFKVCNEFTCMLTILESKSIVGAGYRAIIHLRTISALCKIVEFRGKVDGKMVKKHFARKGEKVLAKIRCETPLALYCGSEKGRMDTFALRDEDMTVAIGAIRAVL